MSLETEELVSEVEMKIFDPFFAVASGVSGTVVSTANVKLTPDSDGETLLVTPRTTRVRNSNFGGALLDQVVVPTTDALATLTQVAAAAAVATGSGGGGSSSGGPASTAAVEAEVSITYVDDTVRIMRVGEERDQIFVYTRRSEVF